jgi:hypothetical protein
MHVDNRASAVRVPSVSKEPKDSAHSMDSVTAAQVPHNTGRRWHGDRECKAENWQDGDNLYITDGR